MLLEGLAILLGVFDLDQKEENEIRIPRVDSNPTFSEFNVKNIVHSKVDGNRDQCSQRDQKRTIPAFLKLSVLIDMGAAPTSLGNLNASVVLLSLMHRSNFSSRKS